MIDWSFFSMTRYILTADRADDRVLLGSTWDGFAERLAEADRLVVRVVVLAKLFATLPASTAWVTPAQRRSILDERLRQATRMQRL